MYIFRVQKEGNLSVSLSLSPSISPCHSSRTFAEGAALPGDLDWVLAALLAGHGGAVGLPVHTLAEGAVVLLPLVFVAQQLVVHPAAGLGAVHGEQLHVCTDIHGVMLGYGRRGEEWGGGGWRGGEREERLRRGWGEERMRGREGGEERRRRGRETVGEDEGRRGEGRR